MTMKILNIEKHTSKQIEQPNPKDYYLLNVFFLLLDVTLFELSIQFSGNEYTNILPSCNLNPGHFTEHILKVIIFIESS